MDYPSLPKFPPPLPLKFPAPPQPRGWRPTPRQARVLRDLAKLAGIVALLLWFWHLADALQRPPRPEPPPLEFEVVLQKYPSVGGTAAEVRAALGTPTRHSGWGGEFAEEESRLGQYNSDKGIPRDRVWWVWVDPADERRWVAVLIAGGQVYDRRWHGVGELTFPSRPGYYDTQLKELRPLP